MLDESLKTKIFDFLKDETNSDGWTINYPEIVSTEAVVYRLSSPSYPHDIALKVYRQQQSLRKKHHYSAIERFSASMNLADSKYRIPKPYGFFDEENCFLMEWVEGDNLREVLWKNCFYKGPIQVNIRKGYKWLKHFHEHANPKNSEVDIARYSRNIDLHSKNLKTEELYNTNPIFTAGYKALNQFSKYFSGYETLHADVHGDLNLSNIIINQSHVVGIDIGAGSSAPVVDDLTQMLNYICINYFNMLTKSDMRKPPDLWEIFNLVLDTYDYPKDQQARDFFLFVFHYQMLHRWISVYDYHRSDESYSYAIKLLGKWRLRNSAVIVKGLTKVINHKLI